MEGTNMYGYPPPPPRHHQGLHSNGHYAHPYNDGTSYQQGLPTSFMTQKQWHQHVANGYRPNRKMLTCGPCNRTFFSQQRLDEHLKDHVECPFPECKLSAHIKVIDQHINNQHMLVNFAALQIDDETWIAERKKRFPTARRAELRRAEQMEKLKRGEKLGLSKKPFAKNDVDRGFKRGRRGEKISQKKDHIATSAVNDKANVTANRQTTKQKESASGYVNKGKHMSEENESGQFTRKKKTKFERPPRPTVEVDLYDSDQEPLGVPPFRGTKHFYESTGEMNYFSSTHNMSKECSEKDFAISDDEEWESEQKGEDDGKIILGGALGSLMGTYSDSEDSEGNEDAAPATTTKASAAVSAPSEQNKNVSDVVKENQKTKGHSLDVEVPVNRSRKRHRTHTKNKRPAKVPRGPKRRKPLLARLLQADIIHERNIILQCVRFIVENNFFVKETQKEIDVEQSETQEHEADSQISFQKPQEVISVTGQITSSSDDVTSIRNPDSECDVSIKCNVMSNKMITGSGDSIKDSNIREKSDAVDCNVSSNSVTETKTNNSQNVNNYDVLSDSTIEADRGNKSGSVNCNIADVSAIKPDRHAAGCSVAGDSVMESN